MIRIYRLLMEEYIVRYFQCRTNFAKKYICLSHKSKRNHVSVGLLVRKTQRIYLNNWGPYIIVNILIQDKPKSFRKFSSELYVNENMVY